MSMGGGGSSGGGGGAIVQSTNPAAAMLAGITGSNAAKEASLAAQDQMNNAINAINTQYRAAASTLRPYTQTGVQALDQLLQYQGLDPYKAIDPGATPTLQQYMDKVTKQQVNNYINQNSSMSSSIADTIGKPGALITGQQPIINWLYSGAGADNQGLIDASNQWAAQNSSKDFQIPQSSVPGQLRESSQHYWTDTTTPLQAFAGQRDVLDPAIRAELAKTPYENALAQYNIDKPNYNQDQAWAQQYGTPLTSTDIADRMSNLPGYQAQLGQGTQAIQNAAGAQGYLGSGRVLKELMNFGQNTLSQFYGQTLSNLANTAGLGANASGQLATGQQNQGNALAGLYQSLGDTQANSALASGNALAQGMITSGQQYNIMGQQGGGGGSGMGGIGSILGGIGSIASAFSSKELKTKISTPSTEEILNGVNKLDLDKWKYKGIDQEFIGPYAEQFQQLFHVGNGQSINMIDAIGVLLGAVKELDKKLELLSTEHKKVA